MTKRPALRLALRLALPVVATSIIATACGGGSDSSAEADPSTTLVSTTVPTADGVPELVEVPFESEPITAGPLFGSGEAAAADAEQSVESTDDDGEQLDTQPDPDDPSNTDPDTVEPDETIDFVPAPEDTPFCGLLEVLEEQPFPSDDSEAMVVIRGWLTQLRDVAVDSVATDLEEFISFLDEAIASNGQLGLDDSEDRLDAVSDRMDDYVNAACYGFGQIDGRTEPVDPQLTEVVLGEPDQADPVFASGLQIPVVEFYGSIRSQPIAYFGIDTTVGAAGSAEPEATEFCLAIHTINNRPQPADSDETEVAVGQAYFDAIAPVVPAELTADFEAIGAWIDVILSAGSFDDATAEANFDGQVATAVETINDYVDTRCTN